jgi:2-aminoadipate transaminase
VQKHFQPITEELALARWTRGSEPSALQGMLTAASQPGILSFALGLPAPELFPVAEYGEALARVLATDPRALQYGPPCETLKEHIVELMKQRGVSCKKEQVYLTAGAQQGMNLLTRVLLDQGGRVMAEELIYTGFQQIIEPYQPERVTVPTDFETGMDLAAVESLLAGGVRPAFIYSITDGHNPLGISMSFANRIRLVELAREYCVPIIEDDPYGFLSYDNRSLPPLRALEDRWVFYVGSFSKLLAPALRVGWVVVPEELVPRLSIVKEASDIDTSTLAQRSVSAYLDRGCLTDHLNRLRLAYSARRSAMQRALKQYFPPDARWVTPSSGVFIWVRLSKEVDTRELLELAIATERVAFIPGSHFCVNGTAKASDCMRLNFSHCSVDLIEEGIARLARVLKVYCWPEQLSRTNP